MPERFDPPGDCPVCGSEVAPQAKACPGCGACHGSGWSGVGACDLDLPENEFDYETFVANEWGRGRHGRNRPRWIVLTAAGLVLLLLIWLLG